MSGGGETVLAWVRSPLSPSWYLREVRRRERGWVYELTKTTWPEMVPVAAGHPEKATDDALALAYRTRREAAEAAKAAQTPPAKPNRRTGFLRAFFGRVKS